MGSIRGGYLSHGEVYVQNPQIWWAHGGKLHGTSPERIGFLKEIMKDTPADVMNFQKDALTRLS